MHEGRRVATLPIDTPPRIGLRAQVRVRCRPDGVGAAAASGPVSRCVGADVLDGVGAGLDGGGDGVG